MENNVTPADDKTPEQIQGEMAQTREALTEKVAALENQVVGSAKTAVDTLTDTVEAVKSLVENAPGAVSDTVRQATHAVTETVKSALDISGHVRNNPWTSVGVSTGLGFITGLLVFRESTRTAAPAPARTPRPAATAMPGTTPVPPPPSPPGVFDELLAMIGRKVREVAETAIDTASAAVNRTVRDGVPKLVDAATEMAADRLAPESVRRG